MIIHKTVHPPRPLQRGTKPIESHSTDIPPFTEIFKK
jgi:hypothetical protein